MLPSIPESKIIAAANEGSDIFFKLITDTLLNAVGGELNATNMQQLNSHQITLLAYLMLRDEVMDGGFVQLIHNGLGPFIFLNPFAKAIRQWGEEMDPEVCGVLHDFSKLIYKGRKLFERYGEQLTVHCTNDEFMALFEQYPEFDTLDDAFIESEEEITMCISHYVDQHLAEFVDVNKSCQ